MRKIVWSVGFWSLLGGCGASEGWNTISFEEAASDSRVAATSQQGGTPGDHADQSCSIVLRSATRARHETTGDFMEQCDDSHCWWIWQGTVDVQTSLLADGAEVFAAYTSTQTGSWWEAPARVASPGGPGFTRLSFSLDQYTPGEHSSVAEIQLVPFVRFPDGSRLFDHNAQNSGSENYVINAGTAHNAQFDTSICVRRADTGALTFDASWNEMTLHRPEHAWTDLAIHYDAARATGCSDVTAFVTFYPGGEHQSGSVRRVVDGETIAVPFQVEVPPSSTEVNVWFHHVGRDKHGEQSCDTWDSNYGSDYVFDVRPTSVAWGCGMSETWVNRFADPATCPSYEVANDVSANHCEVYLNAIGDGFEGHYGIPLRWLDVYLSQGPSDGEVLGAGMLVRYVDRRDASTRSRLVFAKEISPGYWHTGINYLRSNMWGNGRLLNVLDMAFFVDVRRTTGEISRMWDGRQGANYSLDDAFALPTSTKHIAYGRILYGHADSPVFDSKRACQ